MKILFLDKLSGETITGAESHKIEVIKGLASLGYKIFVPIRIKKELGIDGVHTFPIKGGRLKQSKQFYSIARRENIDVVYTRHYLAGKLGIWLKRFLGVKLVYEVNGLFHDEYLLLHGEEKKGKADSISNNDLKVAKNADAIIAVVKEIKEYYIKMGIDGKKIHIIENGVDVDKFKPIPGTKTEICERFGIPSDSPIILFVGQFYPWQGVDVLVKAMKYVVESVPNAKLLLVGYGQEDEKLKSLVKDIGLMDSVIFTGRQKHNLIPKIISSSDVCVSLLIPTKFGSLKMWEYLACGKPVVASIIDGYKFIEKENCGILVEYGDERKTAEAITSILSNKEMARTMGSKGRGYVLKDHTWKIAAKKTYSVIESLANERQ